MTLIALPSRTRFAVECPTSLCDRCSKASISLTARKDQWVCPACRTHLPLSAYEMAARRKKVIAAAVILARGGMTAEEFSRMSESSWSLLAREIGCSKISVETRCEIAAALEDSRDAV